MTDPGGPASGPAGSGPGGPRPSAADRRRRTGATRWRASLVAIALAAVSAAGPARGQETTARRAGFWLEAGPGVGFDTRGDGVVSGHLRAGHALGPHVLVGGDVMVWGQEVSRAFTDAPRTRTAWSLGGTVRAYPSEEGGLYARAGAGVSLAHAGTDGAFETDETGLSLSLGAGHDFRLGDDGPVVAPGLDFYGHFTDAPAGVFVLNVSVGVR